MLTLYPVPALLRTHRPRGGVSLGPLAAPHQLPVAFTQNDPPVLLMANWVLPKKLEPSTVGLLEPSTEIPTVLPENRHESTLGDEFTHRIAPCVVPLPP